MQYNFRVSRRLRPNPLTTTIGPLRIEILEGLRRHRLVLEANESGLSFDLEFVATMNPHEEEQHFRRRNGRVTEQMARAQQLGRLSRLDRNRGRAARDRRSGSWLGQRDHSWGIRAEMRTDETNPPLTFYPPFFYVLDDRAIRDPRPASLLQGTRSRRQDLYFRRGSPPIGDRAKQGSRLHDVSSRHRLGRPIRMARRSRAQNSKRVSPTAPARRIKVRALPARYFLKGGPLRRTERLVAGRRQGQVL